MNQVTAPIAAERAPVAAGAEEPSPPYRWALLTGLAVFALYALTLSRTTAFWDTSEYIATAHILGIPHPPGNPLFVLLARSWELLLAPLPLSIAVKINLFSAAMSAGAAIFWFLVVHRILSFFTASEVVRRVGAVVSVVVSATAFTVWNQSNVNEKVYTVSLFTIALLSWLAFLWRDHVEAHEGKKGRWHDDNVLLLAAYILALSVANHLMAFLAAPALAVFLLWVKPRVLANWRLYVGVLLVAVVGLSVHLYLPLRSGLQPIINEAAPTCESFGEAFESVITLGRSGCENLSAALARTQYAKPPVSERLAPLGAQMANYFQYFDWQWARSLGGRQGYFSPARLPITLLFLALGAFGALQHWRRDRKSAAYMGVLFLTLSLGLTFYMNFKYGFAQAPALGLGMEASEVRERDYFFLVSFSIWGLWVGVGLTELWLRISGRISRDAGREPDRGTLLRGAPVLVLALVPLVLNWSYATRAHDYAARDFAYNLLQSVEPYGVLFTNGDNDTFPLWYLQEVEGIRKDVTVIVGSYFNTPWYAQQIRDLTRPCPTPGAAEEEPTRIVCQRSYTGTLYAPRPAPTGTVLPLSDEQIAISTQSGIVLPSDVTFEARGVTAVLREGAFVTPADQFTLAVIKNAWEERSIHFSSAHTANSLGMSGAVARHGLSYKLVAPADTAGLLRMPQNDPYAWAYGAFLDVNRTRELLWSRFQYHDTLKQDVWMEDATRNIPMYYAYAHIALAQGEALLGREEEADKNIRRAEEWVKLAEEK